MKGLKLVMFTFVCQVVKNIVFLGRVLCHMPDKLDDTEQRNGDEEEESTVKISKEGKGQWVSLTWLARRLCREAKMEAANNPKSTVKVTLHLLSEFFLLC